MNKLRIIFYLLRYFGFKWIFFRIIYALKLHLGYFKKILPSSSWDEYSFKEYLTDINLADPKAYYEYRKKDAPKFFFSPEDRKDFFPFFKEFDKNTTSPAILSDKLKKGVFRYFSRHEFQIGFPPDWFINPLIGEHAPQNWHWSEIRDFEFGDIKVIWEPSRFDFVYALVRAYWRTHNEEYAEIFWQLIEDWREKNQPNQGPNWKCGQEISFRVMAWLFGLYGFLNSPKTTPDRFIIFSQMIAVSGIRIQANLEYAISQRNNHAISEAMGLWSIGIIFPEFCHAAKWADLGRKVLEESGRDLIYDDGSFVQHSVNYHRLILHDYLWAIRLGDLNGKPLSSQLKEKVKKSNNFLYQIQDDITGKLPNYGQNDGALILPLNNCDYQDFRPVIQSVHYLSNQSRCYHKGAWDEDLLWLFGTEALKSSVKIPSRDDLKAETGGYYTLRSKTGFAFIRCATFHDRPGQADMLHFDLWWNGHNIALDAGTYSYNAPEPWNNPFAHSAYHNTVTVDGCDQMDRAGKFLWVPWLKSRVTCHSDSSKGYFTYWEGRHNAYHHLKQPVSHRRGLLRIGDTAWLVLDRMTSNEKHQYRLHWLLPDMPFEWDKDACKLSLKTPAGAYQIQMGMFSEHGKCTLICGDKNSPRGWKSSYYSYREPALSADMTVCSEKELFWTFFCEKSYDIEIDRNLIKINNELYHCDILLQREHIEKSALIEYASLKEPISDYLEVISCTSF
ncbi:MAG: alginate lyase family protein [Desulfococcaceae bacterium]|nr:alginate lyase family protein [Desulfococcaceae bacterium]